ncbi:MAG: hypothetical protein ACREJU_18030 [Nitrospiraceae bacterium]
MSKERTASVCSAIARLAGLACLMLGEALAADKIAGTLAVRDALTMPGRPVMIEASLVQDSLLKPLGIGGEVVEFLVGGKKAGTAMTGGDGRARFEYTPHMRGNLKLTVRLGASTRVQSSEATATLFAWERRRPILLVEFPALTEPVKHLMVPAPSLPGLGGLSDSPIPLPDAAQELKRLTDFFFNVTYISRTGSQDTVKMEELRRWLEQQGFPSGVLTTIGPGKEALVTLIEDLRGQGWDNVKSGVGRTKEFADVLVEQRIEVVIVPEPERGELPKKAQVAKGWKDVRKKIQG